MKKSRIVQPIDLDTTTRRYLTPEEYACTLSISLRMVYHHIEKGSLHAVRIGRVMRIPIRSARVWASIPAA